jgi:hypothetical protein
VTYETMLKANGENAWSAHYGTWRLDRGVREIRDVLDMEKVRTVHITFEDGTESWHRRSRYEHAPEGEIYQPLDDPPEDVRKYLEDPNVRVVVMANGTSYRRAR